MARQNVDIVARSPAVEDLLTKVATLLNEGQPDLALREITRRKLFSPWITNAVGVCQLRRKGFNTALDLYRGLVLGAGGLVLRSDVPVVFKCNYATALLAANNIAGCLSVLGEIHNEPHPAIPRLQHTVECWKARLTRWQRISWRLGMQPQVVVEFDFPLGNLE